MGLPTAVSVASRVLLDTACRLRLGYCGAATARVAIRRAAAVYIVFYKRRIKT